MVFVKNHFMVQLKGRGKNLKSVLDLLWALRKPKAKVLGEQEWGPKFWL